MHARLRFLHQAACSAALEGIPGLVPEPVRQQVSNVALLDLADWHIPEPFSEHLLYAEIFRQLGLAPRESIKHVPRVVAGWRRVYKWLGIELPVLEVEDKRPHLRAAAQGLAKGQRSKHQFIRRPQRLTISSSSSKPGMMSQPNRSSATPEVAPMTKQHAASTATARSCSALSLPTLVVEPGPSKAWPCCNPPASLAIRAGFRRAGCSRVTAAAAAAGKTLAAASEFNFTQACPHISHTQAGESPWGYTPRYIAKAAPRRETHAARKNSRRSKPAPTQLRTWRHEAQTAALLDACDVPRVEASNQSFAERPRHLVWSLTCPGVLTLGAAESHEHCNGTRRISVTTLQHTQRGRRISSPPQKVLARRDTNGPTGRFESETMERVKASTASALSDLYQQHQALVATQSNLQESTAALCIQLHAIGQENISLHQQLLELRRAHKALRTEHSTVLEQLRATQAANQELEARLVAQTHLFISGAQHTPGPCQARIKPLVKQRSADNLQTACKSQSDDEADEHQESGFFGGLDLIGEAIAQMESEERQVAGHPGTLRKAACFADGSDQSGASSALLSKHSGASTPEQVEVGWAPEHAMAAVEQLQVLWPQTLEVVPQRSIRNGGRMAPKRGPNSKARTPARKKQKH